MTATNHVHPFVVLGMIFCATQGPHAGGLSVKALGNCTKKTFPAPEMDV